MLMWINDLTLMDIPIFWFKGTDKRRKFRWKTRFYTALGYTSSTERAVIDHQGRFGINVASTKTLDVGGNAKISGDLEVTGSHGLSSKYTHQKITSSGSATETLNQSGRTATDIIIFVNGIAFLPTDDYSVSGTTLTFVETPQVVL